MNKVLVTGGAGFIGSALIRYLIQEMGCEVCNIDKLTYAGNLESLKAIAKSERYSFCQGDICDAEVVQAVFAHYHPDVVINLAAESHVDRSIDGPAQFIQTNIVGTYQLLEAVRSYYEGLNSVQRVGFRLLHVSTDEVYGSLGDSGKFTEETPYSPRSPYSASKASSDHLVAINSILQWFQIIEKTTN